MGLPDETLSQVTFFSGEGCEECRNIGFKGRKAIFEYLPVDEDIRKEIVANAATERIKAVAARKGMTSLREDGWRKVIKGETTIPEVLRVTLES